MPVTATLNRSRRSRTAWASAPPVCWKTILTFSGDFMGRDNSFAARPVYLPRRGVYVVRKTKREVIEMITAWAALESMAARLITQHASDADIAGLRRMFATFEGDKLHAKLDEYSAVNINFHQAIIKLSGNAVLISLAENLFTHMHMIRRQTIGEEDRVDRSIRDHMNIIQALEARDTERAEDLVRQHALGLAEHVAKHVDYLD